MISKIKPAEPSTRDLIDRIAKALPPDIGADYYREMLYCRSLQENDEILRILRAMQFLTLLMEQVPRGQIRYEELKSLLTLQESSSAILRKGDEIATARSLKREREMIDCINRSIGGFEKLDAIGAVLEVPWLDRAHAVAQAFAESEQKGRNTLVVCATHDEIDRVTEAIRWEGQSLWRRICRTNLLWR